MPLGMPGGREREILTAIVETFIASGEPVGSRTIARASREGLSAATIRNVMADLTDAGFLEQPHTSAGRVPTAEAYRYYVEQLSGEAHLSRENESIIQDTLTGVSDVQEFMERTSHVLSLISHGVGVTVAGMAAMTGPRNALDHVYFSRLGDQKVLAVVVTRSGVVRDRVLRLDIPQSDLDLAARYLNENFRGWTMEDMRAELERRIETERGEYRELMKSIERLYQQGALAAHSGSDVVFVEGAANLVASELAAGGKDRQRLEEMLRTLEEKEKVVRLLGAYLDTKTEAVRVVIGLDEALPGTGSAFSAGPGSAGAASSSLSSSSSSSSSLQNFVLIGAPARVGGEVRGSLAVIGPTRLDYQHTMSAVSYIARMFDKILNESE
jgi:heat-inducible transcriptional repressor